MLKIAVVDDEKEYIDQIQEYIRQYSAEKKREIQTETFCDGSALLENYSPRFDIILLDIEMGKMNGMETAREIRKKDQDVVLVFITNMAQYAINGYDVGALDYVLKPINYYTFSVRLDRAVSRVKKRQPEEILLNLPDGIKRLKVDRIHYVEVQNRMLHYHTEDGIFVVRGTLQGAEETLKESHFVRCNHWYLVNLQYVSEIRKNIVIVAGDELEISRRNKTAFLSELTDYMGMGT
ncbi:LytR/AlgR family response regulator transcription factor [Hungatella effluvii]|uniref:LytR/AlgR family response regulator transcription factor n=1 Tax=Hungatella effluvii TaxID=1096246 RepID=UPI0022DF169A|nr:LytTR family DNA-binding domain-containing protein [Hungatella effluvii]